MTLDDFEFEALSLVIDGSTPYSILFPETRIEVPADPPLGIVRFDGMMRSLADRGLVRLTVWERGQFRQTTQEDHDVIVSEYETGARDSTRVEQIVDRGDIWVDITDQGRAAVTSDPRAADD